jgi:AGCS family alanine or glycine:cation symporter
MIDRFLDWLAVVDGLLWGPWTMVFIAGVAVFFTVKSGFFQVRGLGHILRHTVLAIGRGDRGDSGSMSSFQAAATSLGGTVGMGNMAGVATALSVGGAGAIFWMWLLAFFGMMSKTVEITLGVHYRERGRDGRVRGGPMHTIRRGLGWTPLAYLFSAGMLVNAMFSASLLQSHTVGRAFLASYDVNPYLITSIMAVVTAMVVLGGVRRIGRFSGALVPFMSFAYLAGASVVIALNYQRIPDVLQTIFTYAFTPVAGVGGATGIAVATALKQGMARGMLSNEAGLGTAPMVHATAETAHPFEQGVWGAVEVFVDTIVICSITALAILCTGALDSGESGIELLLQAFSRALPETAAAAIVSISILTFSLSTQIGFFVYFETSLVSLAGVRAFRTLRWLYFVPGVLFAGVADVDRLWVLANISVAVVAIPNLISMLFLSDVFSTLMEDRVSGRSRYTTANVDGTDDVLTR